MKTTQIVGGGMQLGALPFTLTALLAVVQYPASAVASPGRAALLHHIHAYNPNATAAYVQLFDATSGTPPTLGTTPPLYVVAVPAGLAVHLPLEALGIQFAKGVALAATTGPANAVAPGTGLVVSGASS